MATETLNLESLLAKINCKKTFLRKSEMTSGNAYRVSLSYKGKRCSFTFHDNFKNEATKKDFLYALYLDAGCYEESEDIHVFACAFGYGYDNITEAEKAYAGCKKQSERLHRLFKSEEILLLSTIE